MSPSPIHNPCVARAIATLLGTLCLFTACTAPKSRSQPLPLNSERIFQRFGSYGIDVLVQDHRNRISNLYSIKDGEKICRTFAVVKLPENVPASLISEHTRIIQGESLGAVLKQSGWRISKETQWIGKIEDITPSSAAIRLMHLSAPRPLAIHIYDFVVNKGGQEYIYASIAEVHHPNYLTEPDLHHVFETPSKPKRDRVPLRIDRLLESTRTALEQTALH